jgi:hypothetical protein
MQRMSRVNLCGRYRVAVGKSIPHNSIQRWLFMLTEHGLIGQIFTSIFRPSEAFFDLSVNCATSTKTNQRDPSPIFYSILVVDLNMLA